MNIKKILPLFFLLPLVISACGDGENTDIKAFLLTTEGINNVCFENIKSTSNQKFADKYSEGKKILGNNSNSEFVVVDKCPSATMAYCDDIDDIRQYYYEMAQSKGNENFEYSKNSCEENQGKWTYVNETGSASKEEPQQSQKVEVAKTVFIRELENTDPEKGTAEKYKVCQESQPDYADTVMFLYNKNKQQLEYDKQKEAEAKAEGKEFKNTWSNVRSVSLLAQCPEGAVARCEVSNIISYYYTDSANLLDDFKKTCGILSENIWEEY